MLRLTKKSRYGARLVLDIALYGHGKPLKVAEVAARQGISLKFLESIARELCEAGVLTSKRGPKGGFMLGRAPKDISMGDLVRVLEEARGLIECCEAEQPLCGECNLAGDCLTRGIWLEANQALFATLDAYTVESIISRQVERDVIQRLFPPHNNPPVPEVSPATQHDARPGDGRGDNHTVDAPLAGAFTKADKPEKA